MNCEYPNGRMRRNDGTTYPIACDHPAVRNIDGCWFCANHAVMVERGTLDGYYTDGTTVRAAMLETALFNLLRRVDGQSWQTFSCARCC
jgi:hypothetical protein